MSAADATLRFVLASASPARLATLRRAGLCPEVIVSAVDEPAVLATLAGAGTAEQVGRLAAAKADAVAATVSGSALVLGCDSMLDLDGEALGKPGSPEQSVRYWQRLRGRTAVLHTGHCLIDTAAGKRREAAVATEVSFADISDAEIEQYCASGEPENVAGAFTIDGLGGWFVDRLSGDHHTVVGVSLPTLRRMLHELGHTLRELGYPRAAPITPPPITPTG